MNLIIAVIVTAIVAFFWVTAPPGEDGGPHGKPKSGDAPNAMTDQPSTSISAPKKRKGKKNKKSAGATTGKTEDEKENVRKDGTGDRNVITKTDAARTAEPVTATQNALNAPQDSPARASTPARTPVPASPPFVAINPDMDTDDEDGGPMSRVLRLKGPDDLSATDLREADDGWQMVEVAKKPAKPRSISIIGSTASAPPPPSQADPQTLTKKQRENLRKAERVKAAKQAYVDEQQQRLRTYRKEQEKNWVSKEAERDKQHMREKAMAKNGAAAAPDSSSSGGFAGKGIWD
ncbi:hypothetical protein DFJ77DRAFT_513588 [Powellomyces hirtus]|nr:hypothetical protein DFJ77DRAFT_513588 [Powellomyces hirtus]